MCSQTQFKVTLFIYYRNALHERVESPETEILSKEITELHAKEEFKQDGCSEKFPSNSIGYISQRKEYIFFRQSLVIYIGLSESHCKPYENCWNNRLFLHFTLKC